jgi:cytoskeletal protein RodZ
MYFLYKLKLDRFIFIIIHVQTMIDVIKASAKSIPIHLLVRITAMVFLLMLSITTSYQMVLAQKQTSSSGNITAQVEPQGTSLQPTNSSNTTTTTNTTSTTSGNITAQVEPQGTSLKASNATTASGSTPTSTSGNVTASVKPQGTSLQNTNRSTIVGSGESHR